MIVIFQVESYKVSLQSTARENDRLNEDLKSAKREIINYENSTKKLEEEIVQQRDEIGKMITRLTGWYFDICDNTY